MSLEHFAGKEKVATGALHRNPQPARAERDHQRSAVIKSVPRII